MRRVQTSLAACVLLLAIALTLLVIAKEPPWS